MGLREQSIVVCYIEFVFQFSMVQVLVGLQKQFTNNLVFPTWACAAGFNNNNREMRKENSGTRDFKLVTLVRQNLNYIFHVHDQGKLSMQKILT